MRKALILFMFLTACGESETSYVTRCHTVCHAIGGEYVVHYYSYDPYAQSCACAQGNLLVRFAGPHFEPLRSEP